MKRRTHLRLLFLFTVAWAAFWIAGLPSYYQQYSRAAMIRFDGLVLVPISAAFLVVLGRVPRDRRTAASLWLSFYFTVPLAFYDWLYCGLHLGYGLSFLWRFWYLSVYYVIPWALLPSLAAYLNRREASKDATGRA